MSKDEAPKEKGTMNRENAQSELEKVDKLLESTKVKKKELESMFTFTGIYSKVAGRHNILRELRDNTELDDTEKYDKAVNILVDYVNSL